MGEVIGFDITPNSGKAIFFITSYFPDFSFRTVSFKIQNSGSSLRKVLRLNLSRHMDRLGAISVSATREHGLELTLR